MDRVIFILKIEYEYHELISYCGGINYCEGTTKLLQGINVKFDYNDLKGCSLKIKTESEMSIEQIKCKILDALGI